MTYFSRKHAAAYLQLASTLDSATAREGQQEPTVHTRDGLLPVQRGGFARDWVAEPLRSPRSVLTRLLSFLVPYRWSLLLALVLFVAANLLTLLVPQLTRILIDDWLMLRKIEPVPLTLLIGAMALAYVLHSGILV